MWILGKFKKKWPLCVLYWLLSPTEENEKEEDNSESDSEEEDSKKPRYRHRLLRHKLTVSDGESGEEKKGKPKDTKEGKRRNRRKGTQSKCFCQKSISIK